MSLRLAEDVLLSTKGQKAARPGRAPPGFAARPPGAPHAELHRELLHRLMELVSLAERGTQVLRSGGSLDISRLCLESGRPSNHKARETQATTASLSARFAGGLFTNSDEDDVRIQGPSS